MNLTLQILTEDFTIYKLDSITGLDIPSNANFFSLTITDDEYSLMTDRQVNIKSISESSSWKAIKVVGDLPFDIVGVTSNLTSSLAEANLGIMAVCTHDRDYLLVQSNDLNKAIKVLSQSGHEFLG